MRCTSFALLVALTAPCAIAAAGEIVIGPARPLTSQVGIGPVAANAQSPVVASSGDQFLVAWNDDRRFAYTASQVDISSVQATRVSLAGEVLDPAGIRFPADATAVVGAGSSGNEYLVVTLHQLFVVTRDGQLLSGDLRTIEQRPRIVISNGIDYIVSLPDGFDAFRVDRSGHLLGSVDRQWRVALGNNYVDVDEASLCNATSCVDELTVSVLAPDGTVRTFTVAANGNGIVALAASDREVAVLLHLFGGYRIVRISLDGSVHEDDGFVLPHPADSAAIAWDGTSFVAVFAGGGHGWIAVDDAGAVTVEPLPFAVKSPALASARGAVLAVRTDDRYARQVVWNDRNQIAAMLLPHAAGVASARDFIVSLSEHSQTSPRIETVGGRQLVAFIESSGQEEEIVVVPAAGGDEMLRIAGRGRVHGLRAATNGDELFLLWSEDVSEADSMISAAYRAAIVTPALQATMLMELGTCDYWDEPNVMWTGSDYFVFGPNIGHRFAPGGVTLPPPFPFVVENLGFSPAAVSTRRGAWVTEAEIVSPIIDTMVSYFTINISLRTSSTYDRREVSQVNLFGVAPAIASNGRDLIAVTQLSATTFPLVAWWLDDKTPDNLWSTKFPHAAVRNGVFIVTAGGTIAWIGGGAVVLASATLPESSGVPLGYIDLDRGVVESTVPAEGALTIAYVAGPFDPRANGTPRIWLRDMQPPPQQQRHHAAGH